MRQCWLQCTMQWLGAMAVRGSTPSGAHCAVPRHACGSLRHALG